MIVVTGALGFIGSNMIRKLNEAGLGRRIIAVDDFYKEKKEINLNGQYVQEWIHRDIFLEIFAKMPTQIRCVFHLGARTDTTEKSKKIFDELNLEYSKTLWQLCVERQIPFIYASSAATYGDGSQGYNDDHDDIKNLQPLNPYGQSKQDFDVWALEQKTRPPFWAGLKFFNVYGPNETMKGRMASVVFHAYPQVKTNGSVKLFKSHKKGVAHGEQKRDFIFVKDVIDVLWFLYENQQEVESGIYNLGTGQARSFKDLAHAVFTAMDLEPNIDYIDMPKDIRQTYQYFTAAEMGKLRNAGYEKAFTTLEDGVKEYVAFLKRFE